MMGSSPLARGLRVSDCSGWTWYRIIPARAGFTRAHWRMRRMCRDHPRSRGVYFRSRMLPPSMRGSSPLARGLRPSGPRRMSPPRIIPARAGFTTQRPRDPRSHPDHPRSRGVYLRQLIAARELPGSSPLARGLLDGDISGAINTRIIPARAGFTNVCSLQVARCSDHPRSRGVYLRTQFRHGRMRGSSPLARGLRRSVASIVREARIIPARAGFTRWNVYDGGDAEDHPRSRGVYVSSTYRSQPIRGSSPLARGLPPACL